MLSHDDSDWPVVVENISTVFKNWMRILIILAREGANMRVQGNLKTVVVQSNIIFGSETWVGIPCILKVIEDFHQRVYHYINGHTQQIFWDVSL